MQENMIDIGTVLNKFNDTVSIMGEVKAFGIRFITSEGIVREIECRKNVKSPKQTIDSTSDRGKVMYNLKRNGVMLVYDEKEKHPKSVKTAMIFGFRDYKSNQWLNVFH